MAEELIDKYIDRQGIEQDTKFILDKLNEVYGAFQRLDGVKLTIGGASGLGETIPALKEAKTGLDSLEVATRTVTDRLQQMNGQSKEFTQVLLTQTKATKEAAAAELLLAKARNEDAKAESVRNKTSAQTEAQRRREQKLLDQAIDDYYQLSKAYDEAARKAKNYVLRLGENHPIAVQAVKDANDLGNILKKLDAAVGQNQRNVGNYSSAFNGLGLSFSQVARELPSLAINFQTFALAISNNLPMVADELGKARAEISKLKAEGKTAPSLLSKIGSAIFSWQVGLSVGITLFTLYSKQVAGFFKSLFTGSKAFDEAREKTRLFTEAIRESRIEAIKNSAGDVSKLEQYRAIITDVTRNQRDRTEALKAYNNIADEANKIDEKQINNIGLVSSKIAEQIGLIEKRALATAAGSLLAESAEKLLLAKEQARIKAEKDADNDRLITGEIYNKRRANQSTAFYEAERRARIERKIAEEESVKAAQRELDSRKAAFRTLIDAVGFVAEQDQKATKEKAVKAKNNIDEINRLNDQTRRQEFENRKIQIEGEIKDAKAITDNDQLSKQQRLEGLRLFYFASRRLAIEQREFETANLKFETAEGIAEIERRGKEQKLSRAAIEKEKEAFLRKSKTTEVRITREFDRQILDIKRFVYEQEFELAKIGLAKRLREEERIQDELEKVIEKGYNRFLKWLGKRRDAEDKAAEEKKKKDEEYEKQRVELEQRLVSELTDLSFTLLTANIERRKNDIQNEIDLIEERKQREIEAANQTIINLQERAAAVAVIEARANAQREQLQRRQRELDVKKAQFDKAQAIARIIQETAQNVVKYVGNPLLLALAASIGAAQLAAVIAQPIPRYRTGKNADNYEGPAIVGDGGKRELHIREDGSIEVTPDRPTLTYVRKRDVILPDARAAVDAVVSGQNSRRVLEPGAVKDDAVERAILAMRKDVVQAISNQPKSTTAATDSGMAKLWKWGAVQTKYINEQTNW